LLAEGSGIAVLLSRGRLRDLVPLVGGRALSPDEEGEAIAYEQAEDLAPRTVPAT
jgi:hypothetical protein